MRDDDRDELRARFPEPLPPEPRPWLPGELDWLSIVGVILLIACIVGGIALVLFLYRDLPPMGSYISVQELN